MGGELIPCRVETLTSLRRRVQVAQERIHNRDTAGSLAALEKVEQLLGQMIERRGSGTTTLPADHRRPIDEAAMKRCQQSIESQLHPTSAQSSDSGRGAPPPLEEAMRKQARG